MELKNKIDWQVKNLKDCGLSIQAAGRNEFHVIAADVTNFAYYWTKKEPKTFENTSKTGKKYFVLAWKFDNVDKWVSIPTFKKIVVEDWYLIALERKFTNPELIKELDTVAAGYDVEPFVMKDDIYIKSVAKHNRDITKLNDALVKNNTDIIEEEKEQILEANKEKRLTAKKEHVEKMEKLQESIKNIRKEELIKKISDLQSSLAVEPLNSEEIVNHLENEDKLSITEIESYIDLIIDKDFKTKFLTNDFLIYLIKGMTLICNEKKLTVNEKDSKINQFLGDEYINKVNRDDWANAILEMDENDEALDQEEYATDEIVKEAIKKCFHIGKKVNLNKVLLLLDERDINDVDILKVTKLIEQDKDYDTDIVYKNEDALATAIEFIFKQVINK